MRRYSIISQLLLAVQKIEYRIFSRAKEKNTTHIDYMTPYMIS